MKKQRSWFNFALLLATLLGIATFWCVDAWLTPKPETFQLNELFNLPKISANNYYWLHDVNLKYFCLVPHANIAGFEDSHLIHFDNDSHEGMIQKIPHFTLSLKQLTWAQPREKSWRMAYCDEAGQLTVQDVLFAQRTIKTTQLGACLPEQIIDVQIANEGETIVVIRELPLWTLETLLPFGAMIPSSIASPFKVCYAETWDLASHKIISRAAFPASPSHQFSISPDGHWLVQWEGVLPTTIFRSVSSFSSKEVELHKPVLPRGLVAMDTKTGSMKRIATDPVDAEYSIHSRRIMGQQCFVTYERQGRLAGGGWFFGGNLDRKEFNRCYDLGSGELLPWRYSTNSAANGDINEEPLTLPCGTVSSSINDREWPQWLTKLLLSIKIDIEELYPRRGVWKVSCFDNTTGQETATSSAVIPSGNQWLLKHIYPSNYLHYVFIDQDQVSFYRWKVPFTIHSPWWSRGASLLVVVLVLAGYGLLVQRSQRRSGHMQLHLPTA